MNALIEVHLWLLSFPYSKIKRFNPSSAEIGPPHHHPGHRLPHPGISEHPPWGGPQHPDFGPPPHGFNGQPPHMRRQGPPHMNHDDPSLVPNVPYFDLPAGLMAPLVKVSACNGPWLLGLKDQNHVVGIRDSLMWTFIISNPFIQHPLARGLVGVTRAGAEGEGSENCSVFQWCVPVKAGWAHVCERLNLPLKILSLFLESRNPCWFSDGQRDFAVLTWPLVY